MTDLFSILTRIKKKTVIFIMMLSSLQETPAIINTLHLLETFLFKVTYTGTMSG